ncbi:2OG-Fe dioxygenase family protein [Gallibacterium anatis]|uniref:2OG-Fe dioxygenase family protein n=1 Tax=Gallibacterium anatis TaxID=750 RepID=A0AAX3XFY8_9PAST|nr:2OG-Fe dioxygenase family protein [Gallibacterium anatis]KGQ45087.1 hypothetical protein JP29_07660 [Gallibacterium anatis]MDK9429634.1 2OG-Fe dioxygenase family protein [Gallibacterium anatis]MDK9560404.1 2OG-Fe dioxygenase family protein [Gallibacterium anatis]WIM80480.1 2OG-Fe dioxygenase family protein [Gallibacterium anatis]
MYYQLISATNPSIGKWQNQLKEQSYLYISSNEVQKVMRDIFPDYQQGLSDFLQSWFNLAIDKFMADGGTYRERTHAVFSSSVKKKLINKLPYQPHFQTKYYNSLNGDVPRYFEEIPENVLNNKVFSALLKMAHLLFSGIDYKNYYIEAHQFRINAKVGIEGLPTPEGVHRDGVRFVMMVMVSRENIQGGITTIYDLNKKELSQFTLKNILDIAIVDDQKVFHGVSPIYKENLEKNYAYRDVLVITFK